MSAKDNFAQAMKELLNGEVEQPEKEEKKPPVSSSFSSFSQPEPKRPAEARPLQPVRAEPAPVRENFGAVVIEESVPMMGIEPPVPAPAPAPAPMPAPAPVIPEYRAVAPAYSAPPAGFAAPMAPPIAPPVLSSGGSSETTIIAPGTTLVGDMTTAGGLRVGGNIKGNLKVASMMELNGKVIGDIEASDAVIVGSIVRGNVAVENVLTMDADTTIIGDVSAKNVDINGKIKGNLTVEERGHFQSSAVLVGNLMSGTVIIDEGAMLKGDISITSAQTENVAVDEPEFDID